MPATPEQKARQDAKRLAGLMGELHVTNMEIATVLGRIVARAESEKGAPLSGGEMFRKAEQATAEMWSAYNGVMAIFDDLIATE